MNGEEERILSGIRYTLREEFPKYYEELKTRNMLDAIKLDQEYQTGVFSKEEVKEVLVSVKQKVKKR